VIVLDHENQISDINPGAKRILSEDEVVGENIDDVIEGYTDVIDAESGEEVGQEMEVEIDGEVKHLDVL
ncbi:MAG: PAS domain-containing protein, partial [Halobacteria archaeon]|nr:PAS domain-containing protein [Halobacteria archaeon]